MNDKLQSTIEPNCLLTISHFSLSQLVIEYQFKMYTYVHQCCCMALIYKPKGARTATRQRRWPRKETITVADGDGVDPWADNGTLMVWSLRPQLGDISRYISMSLQERIMDVSRGTIGQTHDHHHHHLHQSMCHGMKILEYLTLWVN